jgi:hypothetical protein
MEDYHSAAYFFLSCQAQVHGLMKRTFLLFASSLPPLEPARHTSLDLSWVGRGTLNVTCAAQHVYPEPKIEMVLTMEYTDEKNREGGAIHKRPLFTLKLTLHCNLSNRLWEKRLTSLTDFLKQLLYS